MRGTTALVMVALGLFAALPAAAQQPLDVEATRPLVERPARVVPPPLHYETSRPPDNDFYPQGTKVEHDPAFIEPLAGADETPRGSRQARFSGQDGPNHPVGPPG